MVAWLASRTEGTEWKPSPSSDTLAKTAWAAHSSQGHASFLTVPLSCIWLQLYDQRVGKQLWSSCSKTSHIECITSALGTYTFKTQAKYKQTQLYFTENRMMLSRDPQPTSVHTSATLHVGPMTYDSHPASFPQKVCKKKRVTKYDYRLANKGKVKHNAVWADWEARRCSALQAQGKYSV